MNNEKHIDALLVVLEYIENSTAYKDDELKEAAKTLENYLETFNPN